MTAVQQLQDRIAELEELVGLHERIPWWVATKLTPIGAELLSLLLKREAISRETAHVALYGARPDAEQPDIKIIDAYVCKLRAALRPYGVEIGCVFGRGLYFMTAAEKAKLRALIERVGGDAKKL
jgi:DNA-binding response OmpR family regulator